MPRPLVTIVAAASIGVAAGVLAPLLPAVGDGSAVSRASAPIPSAPVGKASPPSVADLLGDENPITTTFDVKVGPPVQVEGATATVPVFVACPETYTEATVTVRLVQIWKMGSIRNAIGGGGETPIDPAALAQSAPVMSTGVVTVTCNGVPQKVDVPVEAAAGDFASGIGRAFADLGACDESSNCLHTRDNDNVLLRSTAAPALRPRLGRGDGAATSSTTRPRLIDRDRR